MSGKILVVDDEEIVRRIVRLHLEREGWVGVEAGDGVEALEILEREPVSLIICDVKMPRMDGIHFLKNLKSKGAMVPTIMLSGFVDMETALEVMRLGALDYLTKPIQRDTLILSVRRGLEYRELIDDRSRLKEENIKYQEELEQKVFQQTALIEELLTISTQLNALEGLENICNFLIESISRLTQSQRVSVMLHNKASNYLEIIKAKGIPFEVIKKTRQAVGEPIAGRVYSEGKALIMEGIQKKNEGKGYSESKAFISIPILQIPLTVHKNSLGVINVTEKERDLPYTAVDLKILEALAASVSVAIQNELRRMEIESVYLELVKTLAAAVETKDPYTRGHCERVTEISLAIAKTMGLSIPLIRGILLAGILHDIGNIGIPEAILSKAGPLNDQEWIRIKEHPEKGVNILRHLGFLDEAREIIAQHHERFDGTGYPKGLKGETIHLGARILALADTFDAMGSDRPYRLSINQEAIMKEVRSQSGRQFDPRIVEIFLSFFLEKDREDSDKPGPI